MDFKKLLDFQQQYFLFEAVIGLVLVIACFRFRRKRWIGWPWLVGIVVSGGYSLYITGMCVLALATVSESGAMLLIPLMLFSWPIFVLFIALIFARPKGQ
jgi:hypothetical protein